MTTVLTELSGRVDHSPLTIGGNTDMLDNILQILEPKEGAVLSVGVVVSSKVATRSTYLHWGPTASKSMTYDAEKM